jgi:type VII secretion-associated protein (TIGR03931 family)
LAVVGGFVAVQGSGSGSHADNVPMTLLVEGRVGVMVPATWTPRRITSGPGSARVQVVSPADGDIALHITQSLVPFPSTLGHTADSLRTAMAEDVAGVFVEFNPSDHRADRSAVTYREIRQERRIEWAVVVDGAVRIAVGCQSTLGREHLIREACDRAIRSAHAVR